MQQWTPFFEHQIDDILQELKAYVEIESPSTDKTAVDSMANYIAPKFSSMGCKVSRIRQSVQGDQLRIEYGEGPEQLLVLGHYDTVKPIGTLNSEPWTIANGKAMGPGIYDMKAGIVFGYFALKAIKENNLIPNKKIVFFLNSDEEIGSRSSHRQILDEAEKSACVLVLESAMEANLIKTERKTSAEFTIRAIGKSAHAGNHHADGINAIEELAHQVLKVQSFTNYHSGITFSVGMIRGGQASNVVAATAEMTVDVRVVKEEDIPVVTNLMYSLTPVLSGAELTVEGSIDLPPMERTEATIRLFKSAQEEALHEGIILEEGSSAGSSDGNVAAIAKKPILDGLGPIGGNEHAKGEYILIDEIPRRIALITRLLLNL